MLCLAHAVYSCLLRNCKMTLLRIPRFTVNCASACNLFASNCYAACGRVNGVICNGGTCESGSCSCPTYMVGPNSKFLLGDEKIFF